MEADVFVYIHRHGRDGKLHIWQLREQDEEGMSKTLPIDDPVTERKTPWLLHTLIVNAVNFCSFASLASPKTGSTIDTSGDESDNGQDLLIATPGVQDGSIKVTSFPSESRIATIPAPKGTSTGMIMAIGMYFDFDGKKMGSKKLTVIGGYESGHAAVFQRNPEGRWECLYVHKAHSQPVLSLAVLPPTSSTTMTSNKPAQEGAFFTSSADSLIARHPLPSPLSPKPDGADTQVLQTKHAGQQSLALRSDDAIFATAGWDGRARVYSTGDQGSMQELAVLKWHREGCYAVAFAKVWGTEIVRGEVGSNEMLKRDLTVAEKRVQKTRETHWLAVVSKDGKVSLWEVY